MGVERLSIDVIATGITGDLALRPGAPEALFPRLLICEAHKVSGSREHGVNLLIESMICAHRTTQNCAQKPTLTPIHHLRTWCRTVR